MSASSEPAPVDLTALLCLACSRIYPVALADLETRLCLACQAEAGLDLDHLTLGLEPPF